MKRLSLILMLLMAVSVFGTVARDDFEPSVTNTHNLGTASLQFKDAWGDGTLDWDTITDGTLIINAGSITSGVNSSFSGTGFFGGVVTVEGLGTGGPTDYDIKIGDTSGTPTYGMMQFGNACIGRTSFKGGNIDLDGAIIYRNISGPITSEIEHVFVESTGSSTRFALPKSGVGNATYNSRSMFMAGPAPADTNYVKVSYWQTNNNIFDNLACDTAGDGADLGVQNDLEVEGDIFVDSIKESTSGSGITFNNDVTITGDTLINTSSTSALIVEDSGTFDNFVRIDTSTPAFLINKATATANFSIDMLGMPGVPGSTPTQGSFVILKGGPSGNQTGSSGAGATGPSCFFEGGDPGDAVADGGAGNYEGGPGGAGIVRGSVGGRVIGFGSGTEDGGKGGPGIAIGNTGGPATGAGNTSGGGGDARVISGDHGVASGGATDGPIGIISFEMEGPAETSGQQVGLFDTDFNFKVVNDAVINTTLTLSSGSITDSGGSIDFGNENLSSLGTLDITEVFNSGGTLKIMPDIQGNVEVFGDTDTGNAVDGKQFIIHRRAAEGDDSFTMFIDQFRQAFLTSTRDLFFRIGAGREINLDSRADGSVVMFRDSTSGENALFRQAGFITAAGDEVEINWQVDDTLDKFILDREDPNIQAFRVNFDFDVVGASQLGDGGDANYMNIEADADTYWVGPGTGLIFGSMSIESEIVVDVLDTDPCEVFDATQDGWATGQLNEVTFPTGGTEHYLTITEAGIYEIIWNMSLHTNTGGASGVHGGVMIDDVALRFCGEDHTHVFNANDDQSIGAPCIVDLPNGNEEISLWILDENSRDIHVLHSTITIKLIGGT